MLTIEERIACYTQVMHLIVEPGNCKFVCYNLYWVLYRRGIIYPDFVSMLQEFPEFAAQKPKHVRRDCAWWPRDGVEFRIDALKRAIKLCEKSLAEQG